MAKYKNLQTFTPASLPNSDGYEFFGYGKDGFIKKCVVKKCPNTGMHFVTGGYRYKEIYGWVPKR